MGLGSSARVGVGVLLMIGIAFSGESLAGANLRRSNPTDGSTLRTWPASVTLSFVVAIEPHRSQFRAYRLETSARDADAIKQAATSFSLTALAGKADPGKRVDDGALYGERIASSVQVKLKPNPSAGVYIVLWRTFNAVSERFEDGFITFSFSP